MVVATDWDFNTLNYRCFKVLVLNIEQYYGWFGESYEKPDWKLFCLEQITKSNEISQNTSKQFYPCETLLRIRNIDFPHRHRPPPGEPILHRVNPFSWRIFLIRNHINSRRRRNRHGKLPRRPVRNPLCHRRPPEIRHTYTRWFIGKSFHKH